MNYACIQCYSRALAKLVMYRCLSLACVASIIYSWDGWLYKTTLLHVLTDAWGVQEYVLRCTRTYRSVAAVLALFVTRLAVTVRVLVLVSRALHHAVAVVVGVTAFEALVGALRVKLMRKQVHTK